MELRVIVACFFYITSSGQLVQIATDEDWIEYKSKYGLGFGKAEEIFRKEIFVNNYKLINEVNADDRGFTLEMNKFGHLLPSEAGNQCDIKSKILPSPVVNGSGTHLPPREFIDWRKVGVVTRVKDQGECCSAYAISGVEAIESHFAIRTGVLVDLSVQEVLDCASGICAKGCYSGCPDGVFQYSLEHGLSLEKDYPYTALNGSCQVGSKMRKYKLSSYVDIPNMDENEIVRVISFVGPVSLMFDSRPELIFYKSGIIDVENTENVGSCLDIFGVAVGFNRNAKKPYLIVKNNWGTGWGEDGYFRIALFKNVLGLAMFPSYPIVKVEKENFV